ncbi:TIGR02391 family protein [Cellulosimicrobium funkei]|uniref:TIGR02391 family protein n=1 Tax=Cellulosimicrobium funkei TaxID=264251 RepID=UPI0037565364
MAALTAPQKSVLESILGMDTGYVLDFSNASFRDFFEDLGIDIDDESTYGDGSKANRMRALWRVGSNQNVAKTLRALAEYVEAKHSIGQLLHVDAMQLAQIRKTARELDPVVENAGAPVSITTEATVARNLISIKIHEDIYSHIETYISSEDYFHAVEEAYKVVREKLRELTGHEKASEVFNPVAERKTYYGALFGKDEPATQAEGDFFRGIGYLHLGVQYLRNEKAHTLATDIEPNLAIHYLALASLAYDLITKYVSDETVAEIEEAVQSRWRTYRSASAFYDDFAGGRWLNSFERPAELGSTAVRRALKAKWLTEADFTRSWNHSNVVLMRLQLLVDDLTAEDIDRILSLPTKDRFGNDQLAGMDVFLKFVDGRHPTLLSPQARAWLAAHQS